MIIKLRCLTAVVVGVFFSGNTYSIGWNQYLAVRDQKKLNQLNELVGAYSETQGKKPDLHLIDLYRAGLTKSRIHPTPFGGFYRLNAESGLVYNPSRQHMGHALPKGSKQLAENSLQNR